MTVGHFQQTRAFRQGYSIVVITNIVSAKCTVCGLFIIRSDLFRPPKDILIRPVPFRTPTGIVSNSSAAVMNTHVTAWKRKDKQRHIRYQQATPGSVDAAIDRHARQYQLLKHMETQGNAKQQDGRATTSKEQH